ncbi:MAG: hypothetical protein HY735_13040 [Verrucomicrobia bacterium]|nr:hypothetical protein [Verrucomicrobiota bacterium]
MWHLRLSPKEAKGGDLVLEVSVSATNLEEVMTVVMTFWAGTNYEFHRP